MFIYYYDIVEEADVLVEVILNKRIKRARLDDEEAVTVAADITGGGYVG